MDENAPARNDIRLHRGLTIQPMGINQPIISIRHPRYIMISERNENIIVVIGARIDIPPKFMVETAIVALIAKTEAIIARTKYLIMAFALFFGFSRPWENSLKAIIPNVASADNQREISIIA